MFMQVSTLHTRAGMPARGVSSWSDMVDDRSAGKHADGRGRGGPNRSRIGC
jgi:hypothetical protein